MAPKHILLLEGEKGLERSLTLLLKQAGFRVTNCSRGASALAELVSGSVPAGGKDLLIVDIPQPDCEGSRLLKQLDERGITLPLLVITPYGSEENIAELGKNCVALVLCSPFAPADLFRCIRQIA